MSFSSREFRDALGRFATGVCVITIASKDGKPFGITVNSFASVSLDPALVLWSLQKNSDVYDDIVNAERYTINILSTEQQALSDQYAKKSDHDLSPEHFRIGKTGSPVLKNSLVSFECESEAEYDGGDHVILVGRVQDMSNSPAGDPLLFVSGKYRQLH
jgi:flavin reductase (DIM6/NTAB) family NADH-FMN oxidoreductase RutF